MKKLASLLLVLPLVALALPAAAAPKRKPPEREPPLRHLGGAGTWQAYLYTEKTGPVCYLVGDPAKSEPAKFHRQQPVAMVTHRPKEGVYDVVSFTEGYPLRLGSDVSLDVDGSKFNLFTKGDTAWSRTSDTDKQIVQRMTRGRFAIVKGTPKRGPATTDEYSLSGFTHALALIDKACHVKQ